MPSFVELFIKHTKSYESPTSFWKWSAYSTISAVLRDNCFRKLGDVHIFPNIYVLLLADSAIHRKGNPVKLCESLVKKVKSTKVISGRSSIQAILDELARGETDQKTGRVIKGGSALFVAPELSAGIVNDPEAIRILTDIYDYHEDYTSRLRGSGTFKIANLCFSMMAASNEELLKSVYDTGAIFGGLLGRTFLVKPDEFRPGNSLFEYRDTNPGLQEMVERLVKIASLRGEFSFTPEAQKAYDDWYYPFRESYRNRPDKSGVSGRIHTSILKLSMLICVDATVDLEVGKEHVEMAIGEAMDLIPNYNTFVMSSGKSTITEAGSIFLEDLYNAHNHSISRKEILGRHWQRFDSELFDKCVNHMEAAGFVTMNPGEVNGVIYTMTQKCMDLLFKKDMKK